MSEVVLVRRETFYHEREYVQKLEQLATAVLLFHRGGPWTNEDREKWMLLTGREDATTKALCDLARECQAKADYE